MDYCALRLAVGRLVLTLLPGLPLAVAGCAPEAVETEKKAPATKHLMYIEDLQKKGASPTRSPAKGR